MKSKKRHCLPVCLAALVLILPGCAGSGKSGDARVSSSNARDREAYLEKVQEDEEKPLEEKFPGDEALLYDASGPKVRLYVNEEDEIDAVQALNAKGTDIIAEEKLPGYTLEDAVDYLTERAVIRGYLSDNNPNIALTMETVDVEDSESMNRMNAIITVAKKVSEDRMGIHGMKAEVIITPETQAESES